MNNKTLIRWVCIAALFCSCQKEVTEATTRNEYITVYETSPDEPLDAIQVPFAGVQDGQIHVLSNVDLQWKYFVNQTAKYKDWFTIKSVDEVEPGHMVITYDAESLLDLNSLEWRGGRLSLMCPDQSLGKFLSVDQGHDLIFAEPFDSESQGYLTLTGKQNYVTEEYPVLNTDYYDYISFNAWATTDNEFLSKSITLDVTISGGLFYDTGLTTFRVNVPVGDGPDKSNFKYLLIQGNGERLSANTKFTFSTANDDLVYVHVDNFSAYKVTEADIFNMFGDEDYLEEEESEWI